MSFAIPDPAAYGIFPDLGFLSPSEPLRRFSSPILATWDELNTKLPTLLSQGVLREHIARLPLFDAPSILKRNGDELELRRAYVVLAFLIHGHVWTGPAPDARVPVQLSEPFLYVCEQLGLQPVLSYAGLCLWNWTVHCVDEEAKGQETRNSFPMDLNRLRTVASFTGTAGEDAFYLVPDMIEVEGGPLIPLLLDALFETLTVHSDASWAVSKVTAALTQTTSTVDRMSKHLSLLYGTLDAHHFYHVLRPFLAGGKGALPQGMRFQRSDGSETCVECIGGNAGQSSLFPFLDAVLGVVHEPPAELFEEMRAYMPALHRQFLVDVSKLPSLRSFVEAHSQNEQLITAYDGCLKALRSWRSRHISVVSKYIVQPARAEKAQKLDLTLVNGKGGSNGAPNGNGAPPVVEKLEVDGVQFEDKDWELQGTGGSALIPFLRQARDETVGIGKHDA